MADTLEQDVHALKEWLRKAWSCLGQSSLTRFERRELRNQIRQTNAELKRCLHLIAAQRQARQRAQPEPGQSRPEFRILNL